MPLKISRILHAGYVFECDGTQIAFDPIFENPFSRNCHAFPNVRFDHGQINGLKFSAVFISHYHDDHCSLESLDYLNRETPIYLYCLHEELFSWIKELGFTEVRSLEIDVPVAIGSFEIVPRRALDSDVDSMFQIRASGLNVLNVVDSWIDPSALEELGRFAPWDMVLWPFQTMREIGVIAPSMADEACTELPPEWIDQLKALSPRYVVPSSCQFVQEEWSWYNHAMFPITYRQFEKEVRAALPGSRVVRLDPSVSFLLDGDSLRRSEPLAWVQPIGEQDVDYRFIKDMQPPPTEEVARRFAPICAEQAQEVFEFCRSGLLEKFRSLEPSSDAFFLKPRIWRLSVYDHAGVARDFMYRIEQARIELMSGSEEVVSWSTEVPIAKLYGALKAGESLTSMYVRINDHDRTIEAERELAAADPLEDPLIRCLFTGVFGSYQLEQLKRWKEKRGTPFIE